MEGGGWIFFDFLRQFSGQERNVPKNAILKTLIFQGFVIFLTKK